MPVLRNPDRPRFRGPALAAAFGLALLSTSALAPDALAQERRYEPWQGGEQQLDSMLEELRGLIDLAERDSAANPLFLRDLRRLVERYAEATPQPPARGEVWPRRLFEDRFADGDYTRNPAWEVLAGEWRVDPTWGLRSAAISRTSAPGSYAPLPFDLRAAGDDPQDAALALIGSILQGQGLQSRELAPPVIETQGGQSSTGVAAIGIGRGVSNAFRLDMMMADHAEQGQFELRVYQTQSREPGYRLVYLPGGEPTLAIYRSSRSGIVQIARDEGDLDLGRDRASRLVWERDPDGRMRVRIGDETVLEVTDTLFREAWTGLLLINAAGDFSVRRIRVDGV